MSTWFGTSEYSTDESRARELIVTQMLPINEHFNVPPSSIAEFDLSGVSQLNLDGAHLSDCNISSCLVGDFGSRRKSTQIVMTAHRDRPVEKCSYDEHERPLSIKCQLLLQYISNKIVPSATHVKKTALLLNYQIV